MSHLVSYLMSAVMARSAMERRHRDAATEVLLGRDAVGLVLLSFGTSGIRGARACGRRSTSASCAACCG